MEIYQIVYIVLYLGALFTYFIVEVRHNFKNRAIVKIIMASMFLIYAWEEFLRLYYPNYVANWVYFVLLIAITLAYIGDVVLLFNFIIGGISFLIGNIVFTVFGFLYMNFTGHQFVEIWWFILIWIAFFGTYILLAFSKKFNELKKHVPPWGYMPIVCLHSSVAIPLAIVIHNPFIILLAIGLTLFTASDFFIMINHYVMKKSKTCLRINSGLYFIGLLIISLSITYIIFI